MNKDKLIEFAKEQCEIFPEDSEMGRYLRKTLKLLQAEPCEDAVSREGVIKAVDCHTFNADDGLCLDEDISIILEELSPVKPARKRGKWIGTYQIGFGEFAECEVELIDGFVTDNCHCSECGEELEKGERGIYCHNCGAEMGSEET